MTELSPEHQRTATESRQIVTQYILREVMHINPGGYENGDDENEGKN